MAVHPSMTVGRADPDINIWWTSKQGRTRLGGALRSRHQHLVNLQTRKDTFGRCPQIPTSTSGEPPNKEGHVWEVPSVIRRCFQQCDRGSPVGENRPFRTFWWSRTELYNPGRVVLSRRWFTYSQVCVSWGEMFGDDHVDLQPGVCVLGGDVWRWPCSLTARCVCPGGRCLEMTM